MRIRILESAVVDLAAGREFYDRLEIGVGDYFPTMIPSCFTREFIDRCSDS